MLPSSASRSSRGVIAAFLSVALLSSGLLGVLGWKLLDQDRELQKTRLEERRAQAYAGLLAWMRDSPSANGTPSPVNAIQITIDGSRILVSRGTLAYYPQERPPTGEPAHVFDEGERLEYLVNDQSAAAREYRRLIASPEEAIRAGALGRLARVQRRSGAVDDALASYDMLDRVSEQVTVDGFPSTLYARLGRASALEHARRSDALQREARALAADLRQGRWPLSKWDYKARRAELTAWLDTETIDDAEAVAEAEGVEFLWQYRDSLLSSSPPVRPVDVTGGQTLVAWTRDGTGLRGAVAGPTYLAGVLAGIDAESSTRHRLLASSLVAVGLVLVAGWYFILRAIAKEQRTAQLQSDFVSAVSHEFRSPLTSMAHLAEMLEADRFPSEESRRTSYGILVRDAHRLRRLVDDLLDFRQFETGAATLRLESTDLTDFLRSLTTEYQARIVSRGYRIELNEPPMPVHVTADREALARALGNLIDNAVKYSPDCRTVWVDVVRTPPQIAITVRDQGIGIALGEQRQIFDRFVRGAEAKSLRIKGTGLGLAMVRHIVRAHGGEVRVASEPGRGSRFTILLRESVGVVS